MTAEQIAALFTRPDGTFLCARWGRPVAPVIFGLADESLDIFRGAIRAGFAHARHPLADTDPDMGANLMLFFVRDWAELADVPDLDRLTDAPGLPGRLADADADQYRMFRFDADGGIRACLGFLRMSGPLAESHPAQLAEALFMRCALTFARDIAPSAGMAALIRAAYDPVLPVAATDAAHALRLAARMGNA
ncbi:hypothetical protein [Paracoccus aerius]|uniref:Uncharacterized protein n=1 Tax=Paracoccus aerius TaxID=1915382 RepID=A0ABS1S2K2_9RHOB|nr:hypothetical protein [Paracoccus aerius]MBL3672942.1 hypothetical protein [Paracoccus aerius]GHG16279.1 hypothetical protein GCM10017322_11220 [Paracoccus aerius]